MLTLNVKGSVWTIDSWRQSNSTIQWMMNFLNLRLDWRRQAQGLSKDTGICMSREVGNSFVQTQQKWNVWLKHASYWKCSDWLLDPTQKETLAKLRSEEQRLYTSSSATTSIVLLAGQGLELQEKWSVWMFCQFNTSSITAWLYIITRYMFISSDGVQI